MDCEEAASGLRRQSVVVFEPLYGFGVDTSDDNDVAVAPRITPPGSKQAYNA